MIDPVVNKLKKNIFFWSLKTRQSQKVSKLVGHWIMTLLTRIFGKVVFESSTHHLEKALVSYKKKFSSKKKNNFHIIFET